MLPFKPLSDTIMSAVTLLTLILLFGFASEHVASATVFTFTNKCPYTVWPGTYAASGNIIGEGGFELASGAPPAQFSAESGWSGRFWGRTGCSFDSSGQGTCVTGDCGALKCTVSGKPPVTLAEFTLANPSFNMISYDVSLVDGFNLKMSVVPTGGTGACQTSSCASDINSNCPKELQVLDSGSVVACMSACEKFGSDEYCCKGAYNTSDTCKPTQYSQFFKQACPAAYSYAYDDRSSLFACSEADYSITFCP